MLNRLRFKRRPRTIQASMRYKDNMVKLEPPVDKKKAKDTFRKRPIHKRIII
jgi:hypothetical protein